MILLTGLILHSIKLMNTEMIWKENNGLRHNDVLMLNQLIISYLTPLDYQFWCVWLLYCPYHFCVH
jgi:hypothetical protein